MIISGGENIYSIQVEEAIAKNEGVLEVAVIGVPDDEWGESVKAFVVSKPGFSLTSEDIVATASKNLASYQKPKFVEFVSELPKAPTGKILNLISTRSNTVFLPKSSLAVVKIPRGLYNKITILFFSGDILILSYSIIAMGLTS